MSETQLEKRRASLLKRKGQYGLALGVIGVLLLFVGFPPFLLFFIGILAFFIWKVFTSEGRNETRRIFEFYLSANEILRDDERRWYGFEIQETIARGERIVSSMGAAPALVYFGLGALYQKLGDHSSAVRNLSLSIEGDAANETAVMFPSRDLREYVRMLRKIERSPAEAPLTSAGIRALERGRKNRAAMLLEQSRQELARNPAETRELARAAESSGETAAGLEESGPDRDTGKPASVVPDYKSSEKETSRDRKTISELLHDIYDTNVH